jgi:hypothetical protein
MSLNHFKSLAINPVPASLYNVSIECSSTSGYEFTIDVPLPTGIKRYTVGEPDTNSSSVLVLLVNQMEHHTF